MNSHDFDPVQFCVSGVRELKPYEPGKPIAELSRELGIGDIVKLASNENPLGPSPRAIEAIHGEIANVALYPDGNAFALKRALADYHDVGMENVVVGSGSDHILELGGADLLAQGRSAVISQYGFSIYAIVTRAASAELRIARRMRPIIRRNPTDMILRMLADAGRDDARPVHREPQQPDRHLAAFRRAGGLAFAGLSRAHVVVLDEAYYDYVAPFEPEYPDSRGCSIVTRT